MNGVARNCCRRYVIYHVVRVNFRLRLQLANECVAPITSTRTLGMDVHVRRIERELADARSRLEDSTAEISYMEQQSMVQRQQILALSRALSEATQAAADVMANVQLSAYRARDQIAEQRPMVVHNTGLADTVAAVVESLTEEIDQQCTRLNACTTSVHAQLLHQNMSVAVISSDANFQASRSGGLFDATSVIADPLAGGTSQYASSVRSPNTTSADGTRGGGLAGTPVAPTPGVRSALRRLSGPATGPRGNDTGASAGAPLDAVRLLRDELIAVRHRHDADLKRLRLQHEEALGTLACSLKADVEVGRAGRREVRGSRAGLDCN
jgi:hypothetical protein